MKFNLLRGVNNEHFDVARILWALSVLAGIGYAGWHLAFNASFNVIEFGTGMGLLLAGGGGSVAMKDIAVAKAQSAGGVG